MVVVRLLFHLHTRVGSHNNRLLFGFAMTSFPSDEEIRLKRIADQRLRDQANQNATSDMAFLKLENPNISPEEESDTWQSLYTFHLKKLKGELPFNGDRRGRLQEVQLEPDGDHEEG